MRGQNRKFLPENFATLARSADRQYKRPNERLTYSATEEKNQGPQIPKKETKGLREREGEWHFRAWHEGREITGSTNLPATKDNIPAALVARAQALLRLKQPQVQAEKPLVEIFIHDGIKEFNRWCEGEHETEDGKISNTAKWYASSLASVEYYFTENGPRLISSIETGEIQDFKTWRREKTHVGRSAIRGNLLAMSALFKFGRQHRWLKHDPLEGVVIPTAKRKSKMHVFTPEEQKTYLALARLKNQEHADIVEVMFNQGCRPLELKQLEQAKVDLKRRIFEADSKTEAGKRWLKMTDRAFEIFSLRLETPGRWVFPSTVKKGAHVENIQKAHQEVMVQFGFHAVTYDARHTFATRHGVNHKTSLPVLAALLGHSDMTKLKIYVHPSQEDMDAAMKASDFELGDLA